MEKRNTRNEILRVAGSHMQLFGYNSSGIDAILKEAKVPKGSFYHFFKSKEELGLAVIDSFAEALEQNFDRFLSDRKVAPLNRIRNFFEEGLARLTQNECTKGCLLGNFGQEMSDVNERFRFRLDEIFNTWRKRFAGCLREAQGEGTLSKEIDPDVIAYFMLSGYEGAILSAKVMKSPRPMKDFIAVLFSSVLRQ
jgi:TetR/AcrR family transcriptional repressor of nem operon